MKDNIFNFWSSKGDFLDFWGSKKDNLFDFWGWWSIFWSWGSKKDSLFNFWGSWGFLDIIIWSNKKSSRKRNIRKNIKWQKNEKYYWSKTSRLSKYKRVNKDELSNKKYNQLEEKIWRSEEKRRNLEYKRNYTKCWLRKWKKYTTEEKNYIMRANWCK